MHASQTYKAIKKKVLEASGGCVALAKELGINSQAISQWERVPASRVGRISAITGMTPHEIRPDLFEKTAA